MELFWVNWRVRCRTAARLCSFACIVRCPQHRLLRRRPSPVACPRLLCRKFADAVGPGRLRALRSVLSTRHPVLRQHRAALIAAASRYGVGSGGATRPALSPLKTALAAEGFVRCRVNFRVTRSASLRSAAGRQWCRRCGHFSDLGAAGPWARDRSPLTCVIFLLFLYCLVVFNTRVFHLRG